MNPLYAMLGPRNQEMLLRADRQAEAEIEAAQDRADDFAMRCITLGPLIRQQQELQMAEAEAAAHRADVARQKAEDQRKADFDDYCTQQLLAGRQPRSIAEVLSAARGPV